MEKKDKNNLILGIVIVVALLVLFRIIGFGSMGYGMMGGYNYGFMSFDWIFNILVIILIIAGIYWFIKNTKRN